MIKSILYEERGYIHNRNMKMRNFRGSLLSRSFSINEDLRIDKVETHRSCVLIIYNIIVYRFDIENFFPS